MLILRICLTVTVLLISVSSLNSEKSALNRSRRIVNGIDANEYSAPYHAKVIRWTLSESDDNRNYDIFVCGGNLISTSFILTARHCIEKPYRTISVIVGGPHYALSCTNNSTSLHLQIKQVIKYGEEFAAHHMYNHDVALLELKEAIQVSAHIAVIPLANNNNGQALQQRYDYQTGRICGTGLERSIFYGETQPMSSILKCTNVTVSRLDCLMAGVHFPRWILCVKGWGFGLGQSSGGDSGGGLIIGGRLVGVILGAVAKLMPMGPFKYANVAYYLDWIRKFVKIDVE